MADFLTAYNIVHGNEGGYANTPGDKGGETYQGIARVSHPKWGGWVIIDAVKKTRTLRWNEFIKNPALTALVQNFYMATWRDMRGPELKSQAVANFFYDFYTNSGGATKVVQRILVNLFGQSLDVDGDMGPATAAAINAVNPVELYNAMKVARTAYVKALVANDPSNAKFLPEWLRRINRFPNLEKKSSSVA